MNLEKCPWCRGLFEKLNGATHPYIESSPGCWACYGEVLSREYGDKRFFDVDAIHKLTVDTYAVQHPGKPSPQSMRSVGFHLVRLCAIIDKGWSSERTEKYMVRVSKLKDTFWWLEPPMDLGSITILDVYSSSTPDQHVEKVNQWAKCVWNSWKQHHATINSWLPSWE